MARPPATPPADDPGSERVTLTRAELETLVANAAAKAVTDTLVGRKIEPAARDLPTLEDAMATAAARVAEGIPPVSIETDKGHYAHPLCGASVDMVEAFNASAAKRAAAKKAKKEAEEA